jgi:hypothetical protein
MGGIWDRVSFLLTVLIVCLLTEVDSGNHGGGYVYEDKREALGMRVVRSLCDP